MKLFNLAKKNYAEMVKVCGTPLILVLTVIVFNDSKHVLVSANLAEGIIRNIF